MNSEFARSNELERRYEELKADTQLLHNLGVAQKMVEALNKEVPEDMRVQNDEVFFHIRQTPGDPREGALTDVEMFYPDGNLGRYLSVTHGLGTDGTLGKPIEENKLTTDVAERIREIAQRRPLQNTDVALELEVLNRLHG